MANGRKRTKLKQMFSPPTTSPLDDKLQTQDNEDNADDDGLLDELMAQIGAEDESGKSGNAQVLREVAINQEVEATKGGKMSSKDRFKARQARKAEALAATYAPVDVAGDARLAQEAKAEEASILSTCAALNLTMYECPPDGNCMFHAVADQLHVLGLLPAQATNSSTTRRAAAQYMAAHPADFMPFLPSVEGEDGAGALDDGVISPQQFAAYCRSIAETAQWGGQPELLALAKAYRVEIDVVQGERPHIVKTRPEEGASGQGLPVARISYHRRMYGLGEHYNSLRPNVPNFA